mgnify:CR=1 FL=1
MRRPKPTEVFVMDETTDVQKVTEAAAKKTFVELREKVKELMA